MPLPNGESPMSDASQCDCVQCQFKRAIQSATDREYEIEDVIQTFYNALSDLGVCVELFHVVNPEEETVH